MAAIARVAGFHRIAADPAQLSHQLGRTGRAPSSEDLVRAARLAGLKARVVRGMAIERLRKAPTPSIIGLQDGGFAVFGGMDPQGRFRVIEPVVQTPRPPDAEDFAAAWSGSVGLLARRSGVSAGPEPFGFRWFLTSLWHYRRPLGHVLLTSLFVELLALVTPLFFQIVVDKVLAHNSTATFIAVVLGLVGLVLFKSPQTYALSNSTNPIDVELRAKLFQPRAQSSS